MCVFSNYWFKRLAVLFIFLFTSNLSYSWSSVGYYYFRSNLNSSNSSNPSSTTQCNMSKMPGKRYKHGDENAPRVDVRVTYYDWGIATNYGDGKGGSFSGDGWFRYAEKVEFSNKLSVQQKKLASKALRNALSNGSCDIAGALLDATEDPFINEDGIWGIKTDNAKCGVSSSGVSKCEVDSAAELCDENGENCRIVIGNEKEMTLDDYAKTKAKDKNTKDSTSPNSGNASSGSSSGSGSSSSGGGSGSSSSGGKSEDKDNKDKEKNKDKNTGSQGNNNGAIGVGNGKGKGEGDKEGDGKSDFNKPGIEEFDLKSAFSGLKDSLKDLIPDLSMPSGSCPTVSIPIFNMTHNIDVHCRILSQNGSKLTAVFSLIWGFLAIRILLSA